MICEQCGGNRVFSYPPPANGCPGCGAPVCCQTCCDARHDGYNREDDLSESTSSPAIPKMQAFAPMEEMARLLREHSSMEKARDQAVDIALKTQFALASAESARDVQTALLADASAQALSLRTECDRQQEWIDAVIGVANVIPPDFYGYVWDYDNPEDSNEDTFAEYLHNACDQECGQILGMERRVMIARKLPDVLLTVTEVDEHDRPKSWSVTILRPQPLAKE